MAGDTMPIMEFKSEEQAWECLKYWQDKLFLNDWLITININVPELNGRFNWGENSYNLENMTSRISLAYPSGECKQTMMKYCAEKVLVHELLHLKLIFGDESSESIEGKYLNVHEHMLIEQLSKSFILSKYDLPLDWFKNFEVR